MRHAIIFCLSLVAAPNPGTGQDLVFTPVNPSFGGSPLNSSHLQGIASAQRTATARNQPSSTPLSSISGSSGTSQADLFSRQLESRLLSALSSQVVTAIFGDDPQDSGSVIFGTTTVTFDRDTDAINLSIVDTLTGTVTDISVPQLITN